MIPGQPYAFRYHLPEATLFEDMAFAYNLALEIDPHFDSDGNIEANPYLKRRSFYLRTAILSAFYFVEAFLNGIAFDFCYRKGTALDAEDRAFLLEEPKPSGKGGFVSFEKKATQYLKVILGTQHPPLTESNCPPLKFMLTEAKELRDSIVHQSPKLYELSGEAEKTKLMFLIDIGRVDSTVDAAVQLVREISKKLGPESTPLDWLYSRASEGGFPPESFK